jgi:hypothetical protein
MKVHLLFLTVVVFWSPSAHALRCFVPADSAGTNTEIAPGERHDSTSGSPGDPALATFSRGEIGVFRIVRWMITFSWFPALSGIMVRSMFAGGGRGRSSF